MIQTGLACKLSLHKQTSFDLILVCVYIHLYVSTNTYNSFSTGTNDTWDSHWSWPGLSKEKQLAPKTIEINTDLQSSSCRICRVYHVPFSKKPYPLYIIHAKRLILNSKMWLGKWEIEEIYENKMMREGGLTQNGYMAMKSCDWLIPSPLALLFVLQVDYLTRSVTQLWSHYYY